MAEEMGLQQLLQQVYDIWCMRTGNPGQVRFDELQSSLFTMGDVVQNGRLVVSEDEARKAFDKMLDELNEKSLYGQQASFLPEVTKGLPTVVKLLIVALCLVLMGAAAVYAEKVTARTQAEQGVTEAASYSIA